MTMRHMDHPQQMTMDGSTRQQKLYDDAIELLRMTCPAEGFYLATSFGKDSIAAHRLLDEAGVKYDAHHTHTGIDPPELVWFGRKHYPNVEREYAGISMWRLIEKKKIPPMRHMRYCCDVLKEDRGKDRVCVMGIRAVESDRRKKLWAPLAEFRGAGTRLFDPDDIKQTIQSCAIRGKWTVSPLYDWNNDDLWAFIKDRQLPYCELYDQGFERLGCIGCPMATQRLRVHEFQRWPKYRDAYVRTFDRLIDMGKFSNCGCKTGEDIMQWWLQDKVQKKMPDQMELELD